MAIEPMGLRSVGPRSTAEEREFPVVRDGYDRDAVKRYLADIDAYVGELEAWVSRLNIQLAAAEERAGERTELEAAALAIFETRERMLDEARIRAERIEAEATVRARQSQDEAVTRILDDARAQARRIIQTAMDGASRARERVREPSEPVWPEEPVAEDPTLPDVFRLSGDPDADWHEPLQGAGGGESKPSRYERTSAKLPSIGEDATKVYGTLHRLRGEDR